MKMVRLPYSDGWLFVPIDKIEHVFHHGAGNVEVKTMGGIVADIYDFSVDEVLDAIGAEYRALEKSDAREDSSAVWAAFHDKRNALIDSIAARHKEEDDAG